MSSAVWRPRNDAWGPKSPMWNILAGQLRTGKVTPFIGAGACAETLPTGTQLSRHLATEFGYPFVDDAELNRVAQYATIQVNGGINLKNYVAEHLKSQQHKNAHRLGPALSLLATFPIPVYLTTNYDDLIIRALQKVGKHPTALHFPWYIGPQSAAKRQRRPTADRPLVYHLHGTYEMPPSMVLSESDYHAYLGNIAGDLVGEGRMPGAVDRALAENPLLFVGYSLNDWTFRVLYRGLVARIDSMLQNSHVSVQLAPPLTDYEDDTVARAGNYLKDYFGEIKVAVYWGGADEFFLELDRRLGGSLV